MGRTHPGRLPYWRNCVDTPLEDVEDLQEMIDRSRQVTRRTFTRRVVMADREALEASLGYAAAGTRQAKGLTMARDWHVTYHVSRWKGKPCVYVKWSAIEHYFVAEKDR